MDLPRTLSLGTKRLLDEVDEYFQLGASINQGDTVFDLGANVGAFALRAAQHANGNLTLHCFEPSPSTFETLETNFRDHPGLSSTTHKLYRVALGRPDQAGAEQEFFHFRNFPTDSTLDIAAKRAEFELFFRANGARLGARVQRLLPGRLGRMAGEHVRRFVSRMPTGTVGRWMSDRVTGLEVGRCAVDTLEQVVRREGVQRIDLLKVDVEGSEIDVISGAVGVLPRVGAAVIETCDRDERTRNLVEMLGAHGFRKIRIARPRAAVEAGLDNVIVYATR